MSNRAEGALSIESPENIGGAAYQRCYSESQISRAGGGVRKVTHTSKVTHTDSAMSILGRENHSEISDVIGVILPRQILLTLSKTKFSTRNFGPHAKIMKVQKRVATLNLFVNYHYTACYSTHLHRD